MRIWWVTLFSSLVAGAAMAAPPGDVGFLDRAHDINNEEVALGRLAQRRGTSPEVRALGRNLADDHQAADDQLRRVARANQLPVPVRTSERSVRLYRDLANLHGEAFDHSFVEHMVNGHQEAIGLFQREVETGTNPALRNYASEQLPVLHRHEMHARRDLMTR